MKIAATLLAFALVIASFSVIIGRSYCGQIGQAVRVNAEWGFRDGCQLETKPGLWTPLHKIQVEQSA